MEKIKAIGIMAVVIVAIAVIEATAVLMPAQAADLSGELTIAGSTTVLPINQECARLRMEEKTELRISVSGGNLDHGVKAVETGERDIGAALRDIRAKEKEGVVKQHNAI